MMIPYGYKQTEAGVIPEDWELLLLGKTAKVYRGGSPRPIQSYITRFIRWMTRMEKKA